ncbi:hypothetical protein OCU04_008327 [Sclerotinia nivalis]|uniref:Uncharacterized protein n=1 Tax=Sclerotinia nivalis TaxID=352851 RepID=A0A9X0AHW1_9HELO|nr:hypothetical protein OCU04_008327 [Sclerotinia nivalis]
MRRKCSIKEPTVQTSITIKPQSLREPSSHSRLTQSVKIHPSSTMRRSQRRWMFQEDVVLLEKTKEQLDSPTGISLGTVSNAIPNRNNRDCRKRWYKLTGTKKGFWTAGEDERLVEGVQKYGSQWVRVAEVVGPGTRNPDQCAKRWQQCLDPSLGRSEWTNEQDVQLIFAVTDNNTSWKVIRESVFPNRSIDHQPWN